MKRRPPPLSPEVRAQREAANGHWLDRLEAHQDAVSIRHPGPRGEEKPMRRIPLPPRKQEDT